MKGRFFMQIVIVGGSFAGMSCALTAARLYPNAEIKVIDKQATVGFIPSGLNLKLNGEIKDLAEAYFLTEKEYLMAGIQLLREQEVTAIYPDTQTVETIHSNGDKQVITYDKLVLAMGSKQSSKLVSHLNDERIVSTKEYHYAQEADRIIEAAQHIAVIGGGQIGMEASQALVNANKQVSLIEANETLASRYFDTEFVRDIQEAIELAGVDLYLGETVEAISTEPLKITTKQSEIYPDVIILGVNLIPNSQLVEEIVTLNEDRTIQVNDYLQTSVPNIYAIGDLIQTPYSFDEAHHFIALVNNAIRSGQVAAFNLASETVKHATSLRVIGSRVFSQYIVSVGMTEQEATSRMDAQSMMVTAPYTLTDDTEVYLKLVAEKASGRILGAQLRSEQNILGYADTIALAIGQGLTDSELAFQDRLYYPRETSAYPILYQAGLRSFEERVKKMR